MGFSFGVLGKDTFQEVHHNVALELYILSSHLLSSQRPSPNAGYHVRDQLFRRPCSQKMG
jgi:hypothetical protein